jgi:hypothetical protein
MHQEIVAQSRSQSYTAAARITRNDARHPTGRYVGEGTAYVNPQMAELAATG